MARNSDCAGGECGFYYFAYQTPAGKVQPVPAPSARLLTVQWELYNPNCVSGDTFDRTLKLWGAVTDNALRSVGGVFLTACDSGVTFFDFPASDLLPYGLLPPHNAAAVGIVRDATLDSEGDFTQFTLHSRSSDVAQGQCAFYAFAISQPETEEGRTGDAGSLIIDSGTVSATDLLGQGGSFNPSGQAGDTTPQLAVYFNQPYLTPPVVLLTANNVGAESVPNAAFAVGIAQNVTPNGFN